LCLPNVCLPWVFKNELFSPNACVVPTIISKKFHFQSYLFNEVRYFLQCKSRHLRDKSFMDGRGFDYRRGLNPDTSGSLWPWVATKMHKKMFSSQNLSVYVMIYFARHSRKKIYSSKKWMKSVLVLAWSAFNYCFWWHC